MRPINRIFLLIGFTLMAGYAQAQFSISQVTPNDVDTKAYNDSIKRSALDNQFFSESRYQAERRRLRNERNTVELNAQLLMSQTSFVNWTAGGADLFAGNGVLFFRHNYRRGKLGFTTQFDSRYGVNVISGQAFKTEDNFILNTGTSWNIHKNWSFAGTFQFRSQFSSGYRSRTDKTLVSYFMAPGTATLAAGFIYTNLKTPLTINISPLAGSMTFVLSDEVYNQFGPDQEQIFHGVKRGDREHTILGSSLQIDYNNKFYKERLTYRTYFYILTNYGTTTYSIWNNTLQIKVMKYFTIDPFLSLIYDTNAVKPDHPHPLQANYVLGMGLTYVFKNK